jgi:hypothetical protein
MASPRLLLRENVKRPFLLLTLQRSCPWAEVHLLKPHLGLPKSERHPLDRMGNERQAFQAKLHPLTFPERSPSLEPLMAQNDSRTLESLPSLGSLLSVQPNEKHLWELKGLGRTLTELWRGVNERLQLENGRDQMGLQHPNSHLSRLLMLITPTTVSLEIIR